MDPGDSEGANGDIVHANKGDRGVKTGENLTAV